MRRKLLAGFLAVVLAAGAPAVALAQAPAASPHPDLAADSAKLPAGVSAAQMRAFVADLIVRLRRAAAPPVL